MVNGLWRPKAALLLVTASLLLLQPGVMAGGAPAEVGPGEAGMEEQSAPVVVDGAVLFKVRGTTARPAEARAEAVAAAIVALAADPAFDRQTLHLKTDSDATLLVAGTKLVMAITEGDARLEGIDQQLLARGILARVGEAIETWRRDRSPANLRRGFLISLGATLLVAFGLWAGRWFFLRLRRYLDGRLRLRIRDLKIREFRVVRAQQMWGLLDGGLALLGAIGSLAALYAYLNLVLALFPWTRGLAINLAALVLAPLRTLALGFLGIVPNLAFLAVLYFVTRYSLKLARLFFGRVAEGSLALPDFDAEWAWPTYRLVRLFLFAFMLVVAYPYIPGSQSEAFKGVSIFLGVVFSLGSSSLVGNLISGYTMTYRRAFKVGDRVEIGSHSGDVEQVRMLVTHLRTPKNELVAIPNSLIVNGEVVNYSALARKDGLILHTTVGIGYEIPWRQVEAMLLEAAGRTPGLLREPSPFVQQKGLGDFAVTYELNVYCDAPQAMNRLYSELHRSILDVFNSYGVQIMTPAYEGDPDRPKVVPRELWYAAPAKGPAETPPGPSPEGVTRKSPQ